MPRQVALSRWAPCEVPACLPRSFQVLRDSYQALQNGFTAVEESRFAAAEREVVRGAELGAKAQEDMAACISSAGL